VLEGRRSCIGRNHLPDGPEQAQRDAELASGDPLRQSAWLYAHDLDADLQGHPA
jgi:salicylate hydroxylase